MSVILYIGERLGKVITDSLAGGPCRQVSCRAPISAGSQIFTAKLEKGVFLCESSMGKSD